MLKAILFNHKKSPKILPYLYSYVQSKSVTLVGTNPYHLSNYSEFAGKKMESAKESSPKTPPKPPFVKNLFIGNFDKEVLNYPQIGNQDRYEMLQEMINPIDAFFQEVNSEKIDSEAKIPPEVMQVLKKLGLYGIQIPEEYGGLGLRNMEYGRIAEVFAWDGSIAVTLLNHITLGVPGLLIAGSSEQKQKYLPKFSSGEWTAALCVIEADSDNLFDAAAIHLTAVPTDDGKGYLLSGTKSLVYNGATADLLTVIGRVKSHDATTSNDGALTLFLVERNFGGVRSGQQEQKSGIRGTDTTQVHFDTTFVPNENILGNVGDGYKLVLSILNSGRFSQGCFCVGVLKNLLKATLPKVIAEQYMGSSLSEFTIVKDKLARAAVDIYAMESIAYLTAGFTDNCEDQDCTVESAIVKVFCSEKLSEHVPNFMELLGGMSFFREHPFERILRDSRVGEEYDGANDIMKQFIGLSGLQLAGKELFDIVEKLRNPLLYPYYTLKSYCESIRYHRYDPKLDLDLYKCVHIALNKSADKLEYCTKRFRYATEDLLEKTGKNVVLPSNQLNVKRMADIAIDLYAMTAVIARASRSHYLEFHNSEHEINLANCFVLEAAERIEKNLNIVSCPTDDSSIIFKKLSDSIFDKRGYPLESALTRTFW